MRGRQPGPVSAQIRYYYFSWPHRLKLRGSWNFFKTLYYSKRDINIRKKEERWGVIQEKCRETLLSGWRFSGVLKKWKWDQLLYEGSKMKGILRSISRVSGCARQYSRNIWRQLKLFLNSFWWQKFCSLELSFVPNWTIWVMALQVLLPPTWLPDLQVQGFIFILLYSLRTKLRAAHGSNP